jgi:hypothetical protein
MTTMQNEISKLVKKSDMYRAQYEAHRKVCKLRGVGCLECDTLWHTAKELRLRADTLLAGDDWIGGYGPTEGR